MYYLEYYAKTTAEPNDCLMTSINKTSLEIEILGTGEKKIVNIPIDPPLKQASILNTCSQSQLIYIYSGRGKRRESS